MPVVSAVLHAIPGKMDTLRTTLAQDPRITLGEPQDDRLPVVAVTSNRIDDKQLWRDLEFNDNIRFFELAFADFSDIHPEGGQ